MDSKPSVYEKTKEVDVNNYDYYFVLLDYISSTNLGFTGGGRVPCIRTAGDMYGYELLSLHKRYEAQSSYSFNFGTHGYVGAEV